MIIDFNNIEEQELAHFKGGEKAFNAKMFFDGSVRIMNGRLVPGASIGLHTHETNCEVLFVTQGCGHVVFDGERIAIREGQCHYCPKGHSHTLINDSEAELKFVAVVPEQ